MSRAYEIERHLILTRGILADIRNISVKLATLHTAVDSYATADATSLLADLESQLKGALNELQVQLIAADEREAA